MHQRLGSFLLAAAAICAWPPQPAQGQTILTLEAALAEARAVNPSIKQAQAALDEAGAGVTIARSALLPRVTFTESWQRGNSSVFAFSTLLGARQFTAADFAVDRLNNPGTVSAYGSHVMLHQTVFDGGRSRAATGAAGSARDAVTADFDRAVASVALDVVRAYGRVLAAEAAMRAATAAVDAAAQDLQRAGRRRDAGAATDADVLAITVHVADARQRGIAAAGDAAIARAELNRLTGAPIDRVFETVEPPLPEAAPGDLPALFAEAAAARPEIRRAAATEELARLKQQEASRAAWVPNVFARAGYDTVGLSFTDRAGAWMAGADLTWSLSFGGAEAARAKAASAQLNAVRAAGLDTRAGIQVEVLSAVRRLEAAQASLVIGRQTVLAARESHRILRNRYDAGLAGVADVLRAAAAELDADRARTRAVVDAIIAHAELRRALGRPMTAAVPLQFQ